VTYSVTELGSEILLIEPLLDADTCAQVIEVAEHCQFTVDQAAHDRGIVMFNARDAVQQTTNQLFTLPIQVIQQALHRAYGVQFGQAESCVIWRYLPGQQDKRHVDNLRLTNRFEEVEQGIPTRDVAVIGCLNDDFEGGEIFFDRQSIKVTPKAGSAIVFPAYYTHPHQALPVRTGQKYAWATWLYH
jgi:prolyl 4-hydroxylase